MTPEAYLKRLEEAVNTPFAHPYPNVEIKPEILQGCKLLLRLAPHINAMCEKYAAWNDDNLLDESFFDQVQSIIEILKEQKDG